MAKVAPTDESSGIAFERNFNPMLKRDSAYYGKLGDMISCVEQNVGKEGVDESTVCAKEFKAMRLTAFKNELLYHNVNKRFYMDLIQYKRHEAPI